MRRIAVPGAFAALGLAILLGLGIWQLERLQWKEALIARVNSRLSATPAPAPGPDAWTNLDVADLEYTPVTVAGHFDNAHEAYVVDSLTEPRGKYSGFGYLVMTPFVTDAGWTVYVNRGFVPTDRKAPESRKGSQIEGETSVTGLVRAAHDRSWFMPSDRPSGNEWFSRDPHLYAAAAGLTGKQVAPYLIDAKFDPTLPGGLPQGGETIIDFPNNHLQYALTWFGLAGGLAVVFIIFARGRLKVPAPSAGSDRPHEARRKGR